MSSNTEEGTEGGYLLSVWERRSTRLMGAKLGGRTLEESLNRHVRFYAMSKARAWVREAGSSTLWAEGRQAGIRRKGKDARLLAWCRRGRGNRLLVSVDREARAGWRRRLMEKGGRSTRSPLKARRYGRGLIKLENFASTVLMSRRGKSLEAVLGTSVGREGRSLMNGFWSIRRGSSPLYERKFSGGSKKKPMPFLMRQVFMDRHFSDGCTPGFGFLGSSDMGWLSVGTTAWRCQPTLRN